MLPLALATERNQDPNLISDQGDDREQRPGGSSLCCIQVLFFVFNFQMNNSVAMPRLKYFSVFSKM